MYDYFVIKMFSKSFVKVLKFASYLSIETFFLTTVMPMKLKRKIVSS